MANKECVYTNGPKGYQSVAYCHEIPLINKKISQPRNEKILEQNLEIHFFFKATVLLWFHIENSLAL